MDATTDDTTDDADASADETADDTAEEAAVGVGTEMGTPADSQVLLTPEMTEAWSAALHAFWTQGVTEAKRESDFWQWHLKSVSSEQPSEPRAVRKHWSCRALVG